MIVIAIDPGSMRTGVAMLKYSEETKRANLFYLEIIPREDIDDIFALIARTEADAPKHHIVVEDFKHAMAQGNFRGKKSATMAKDEAETHALAKKIKAAATYAGHTLIIQDPRILSMGRKWCDLPVPKTGHIPDDKSAYIHGAHYLMESGRIKTVDDINKFGQEKVDA